MFVGRESELSRLNRMYNSNKFEMAVIYGRRRVGKTTLINEFCKNKATVLFPAIESNAEQNLEILSGAISYLQNGESNAEFRYKSFANAFSRLEELSKDKRIVFVIDEYPYLAKADKSISSVLQKYIDHNFKNTKLFVILCGSSMSFMEKQVLGYQSPLYGRRTAQFKIEPFDYYDTGKWFPNYTDEEKAIMYGITGGVPLYLEEFSPVLSIKENLLENLFDKNAMLYEEPSNLLKQELREPATYNAIISAVASGKSKLSEISSTGGIENGLCTKYIANLISLGIIKKEIPVTEPKSKRPIYQIEDNFFRFWFTFVAKNTAAIVSGRIDKSYDEVVGKHLPDYMGVIFEKMCRDYILYYDNAMPFNIAEIGQWWGGNPKTKKQAQIDVVVTSSDGNRGIVGSCKFKNGKIGLDELSIMREYAEAMGRFEEKYFYFFSKSGFTDDMMESKGDHTRFITLFDMYHLEGK